ncbi:unnamed protein product [Cercopithifilaria johnstoni]|uniref:Uncharacterized protein n=1 Tax=Cercopithifilaria johnstoni TaxID=2874296 RepID=A0A8J2M6A6_9BILA|nr:unnamed protein product [Cercopithifilaria johnstoni]
MLRYSLFYLIFYLDFFILPATLNKIDIRREMDHHSKYPYKHFGQHYEYIYETPSSPDQKPKFRLSYDSIGDDTDITRTIKRINNLTNHKPKKHWQSNFLNAQQFQEKYFIHQRKNSDTANFPQTINNIYMKNGWKENENARKRMQEEYEIIRQLVNDIFEQAQEEMSRYPTFDVSRFRKIFSSATDMSAPLSENYFSRRRENPTYDSDRFRSVKGKDKNIHQKFHTHSSQKQYNKHRMPENARHKIKTNKERLKDMIRHLTNNGSLKQLRNDASYQLFGILPKFDPRFPFDRAYKLMDDLRPPEILKFPSINFNN